MTVIALRPPNPAVRLRLVQPQDASSLCADCWRDRSEPEAVALIRLVQRYTAEASGCGIVALAEDNRTVIGYGQLYTWVRCGEISDLMVSEARRSQGIGTAIIQYLTQVALRLQMPCVEIGVALSNPLARALYERLGFQRDHQTMLDLGSGSEIVQYLVIRLAGAE